MVRKVLKLHMTCVTGICFNSTGRFVLSGALDAGVAVTQITNAVRANAARMERGSGTANRVKFVICILAILMTCLLQFIRVLKTSYNMDMDEIIVYLASFLGVRLPLARKDEL
jgi:hypothetical protein